MKYLKYRFGFLPNCRSINITLYLLHDTLFHFTYIGMITTHFQLIIIRFLRTFQLLKKKTKYNKKYTFLKEQSIFYFPANKKVTSVSIYESLSLSSIASFLQNTNYPPSTAKNALCF